MKKERARSLAAPDTPHPNTHIPHTRKSGECEGQSSLMVGDIVVAVFGERLSGRYLGDVLPLMGAGPYVLTVQRAAPQVL